METKKNKDNYKKRYNKAIDSINAVLFNNDKAVEIDEEAAFELLILDEDGDLIGTPSQCFLINDEEQANRFSYLTDGRFTYSPNLDLYICAVYKIGIEWHLAYPNKKI